MFRGADGLTRRVVVPPCRCGATSWQVQLDAQRLRCRDCGHTRPVPWELRTRSYADEP